MENSATDLRQSMTAFSGSPLDHSAEEPEVYKDIYGLPFESANEFSDAPLEFEELAETLWDDLRAACLLAARYNRQSPFYLILCNHLEKNIRLLGSLCVTKAVLEQKDIIFPKLDSLCIPELYTMVSFHFRKCHAAFSDLQEQNKGLDMKLLDWIFRWAQLSERLKATEEKIRRIREGKLDADRLLERAEVFHGEARHHSVQRNPKEIQKTSSLPILGSYARSLVRKKRREDARKAREERRWKRASLRSGSCGSPGQAITAGPYPTSSVSETLRNVLLNRAKAEGDEEAMKAIPTENEEELEFRFREYVKRRARQTAPPDPRGSRQGPSDEVRKKLREKRKKKK